MSLSARVTLPPRPADVNADANKVDVIQHTWPAPAPRVLDVGSKNGRPFRAFLEWQASGGQAGQAFISVSTSIRVCVVARDLTLRAINMHASDNNVAAVLADGELGGTRNTWDVEFSAAPTNVNVPIPSYALAVTLDPSDVAATGTLTLVAGDGTVIAVRDLTTMPPTGLRLGSADQVRVTCSHPCRVVFDLAI